MRLVAESLYIKDFQGICLLTNESGMESAYQKMIAEKFGYIIMALSGCICCPELYFKAIRELKQMKM